MYSSYAKISDLVGITFTNVVEGDEHIDFIVDENHYFSMYHEQDCCENVYLQDVCGDLEDLVGTPILQAEEVCDSDCPPLNGYEESYTWTFYKIATIKGSVTMRWFGSSNGYYSERVDVKRFWDE